MYSVRGFFHFGSIDPSMAGMGFKGIRGLVPFLGLIVVFLVLLAVEDVVDAACFPAVRFNENYETSSDAAHTRVLDGGTAVNLVLDQLSGNNFFWYKILLLLLLRLLHLHYYEYNNLQH